MTDIRISGALWNTSMSPEGILETWRLASGSVVKAGAPLAEVRVEGAVHEVLAPASGRLTALAQGNSIVEPGTVIGRVDPV